MAQQGKAYTIEQKKMILESMQPFLELGFTRRKACKLVGLDETTFSKWVSGDIGLSMKVTGWENMTTALAVANIQMAIRKEAESEDDIRKENSWKWAERKEDSLKPKQDVTSNNETVQVNGFNFVKNDTDNKAD